MPHWLCVLDDLHEAHLLIPLLVFNFRRFRHNRSIAMISYAHLSPITVPTAQDRSSGGTANRRQPCGRRKT